MIPKSVIAVIIFNAVLCEGLLGVLAQTQQTNEICGICKAQVQKARDQIPRIQDEIKEQLKRSCSDLPFVAFEISCINLVDEMVPKYEEMLLSRMDPKQICTLAGLCYSID